MSDIRFLVENFTNQLTALVEGQALDRARAAVESALGVRPGRQARTAPPTFGNKARKKPPTQFCPVPGCKNPAAPVFGMVCAKHKDVPKAKIKKYREARKAKKLGIKLAKAAKPVKTPAKPAKATKRQTKKVRPAPVIPPVAAAA